MANFAKKIVPDWHCNENVKPKYVKKCTNQKLCLRWKIREECLNSKIALSSPVCEMEKTYGSWTKVNVQKCEMAKHATVKPDDVALLQLPAYPTQEKETKERSVSKPNIFALPENDFMYSRHFNIMREGLVQIYR